MHKQFLGSLIVVQLCSSLSGMDIHVDTNCEFAMREVVIPHVDHDAQRQLAVVNKMFNKVIEENYRKDKQHIERLIQENNSPIVLGQVSWNRNFSACACANVVIDNDAQKFLELKLVSLHDGLLLTHSAKWGDYKCSITEKNPFFDQQGRACFYGFGCLKGHSYTPCQGSIYKYSVDLHGESKPTQCYIAFNAQDLDNQSWYLGCCLIKFPVLLRVILASTHVEECLKADTIIYCLDGVTIPDDYKKYVSCEYGRYASYDELSPVIRKAIDTKYAQQCEQINCELAMREVVIPHVDYDAQRQLAVVNKAFNKIIEDNHRKYKKNIECLMRENNSGIVPEHITWNKNFSACTCATIITNITAHDRAKNMKWLKLLIVGMRDGHIFTNSETWGDYEFSVMPKKPFFDHRGMACFYGYGSNFVADYGMIFDVIKYSISLSDEKTALRCMLSLKIEPTGNDKHDRPIGMFLEFPVLLQAILAARYREIFSEAPMIVYDLDDVIIPDDYKTYMSKSGRLYYDYRSYDALPRYIKNAIDAKYAQQKREKIN